MPLGPKIRVPWEHPRTPEQNDENWRWLNRLQEDDGSGTRWATLVIAASDSTPAGQATADYVCTGSNDAATINAAILALTDRASTTSLGRIVLLEGTYRIGATAIQTSALAGRALHIQGMGGGTGHTTTRGATYILAPSGSAFSFVGSGAASGSSVEITDVHVVGGGATAAIKGQDCPMRIERCTVTNSGTGGAISQSNTTGASGITHIVNCIVASTHASGSAISVDVGAGLDEPIFVIGNRVSQAGTTVPAISCGNNISTIPSYMVADNYVLGGSAGIFIRGNSTEASAVSGNVVRNASIGYLIAGYSHVVSGNSAISCTTGFSTANAIDAQYIDFTGNNIYGCTNAFLLPSGVSVTIIGNKAALCSNAYTISGGVTGTFVGYNDFGGTTGTDSGTSTTFASGVPSGGTSQFVLKKLSGTSGDFGWALDPAIDAIAAKGSVLVGTAADALASVTPTKDAQLFVSDSAQTTGVKWGRRLFVQTTDPALSITPDLGDIWIDTT